MTEIGDLGAILADLVNFAFEQGVAATTRLSIDEQKALGQFMTPPRIADTMARRACGSLDGSTIRILEPAAGSGILAAAALEVLLDRVERPNEVSVTLYELDQRLLPGLRSLADRMRRAGREKGVVVSVSLKNEDFLLSGTAIQRSEQFDLVIANPPYFKLRKASPQASAHAYAVHGQPNIYGLFMAATSQLLAPGGRWCFITPRSWTNGAYFAGMRRHMLTWLRLDAIHVFDSREAHFTDDNVLQEAMITWATAQGVEAQNIVVSTSVGQHDLDSAELRSLPMTRVVGDNADRSIIVPIYGMANNLGCSQTLESLGLKVSTGPVVAFRAKSHILTERSRSSVPLLWMQHVARSKVSWPIGKGGEHIRASLANSWMLVPNTPMVIMRRFSPKEDIRRVSAAPYLANLPGDQIGLENHLNYIYRPKGVLTNEEVMGLAAYLNSRRVDGYFRSVSGSTQVNASEMRNLPVPTIAQLADIGRGCFVAMPLSKVDALVERTLGLQEFAA